MSPTTVPTSAPTTTPTFHITNSPMPQAQYAALRRSRSRWASAKATVSSIMRCVPSSRFAQDDPRASATAKPNGTCRALMSRPATTAATGLPPEATSPTNMNWAAPAKTATDSSMGNHTGRPEPTVIAPNDSPTRPSARHTSAMSRARSRSKVRHIERITF